MGIRPILVTCILLGTGWVIACGGRTLDETTPIDGGASSTGTSSPTDPTGGPTSTPPSPPNPTGTNTTTPPTPPNTNSLYNTPICRTDFEPFNACGGTIEAGSYTIQNYCVPDFERFACPGVVTFQDDFKIGGEVLFSDATATNISMTTLISSYSIQIKKDVPLGCYKGETCATLGAELEDQGGLPYDCAQGRVAFCTCSVNVPFIQVPAQPERKETYRYSGTQIVNTRGGGGDRFQFCVKSNKDVLLYDPSSRVALRLGYQPKK